jgi:hypothetical protein
MEFLSLSAEQVAGIFGGIAAFAIALYLLDRTRREQTVATLRFWIEAGQSSAVTRSLRIDEPLSLLMQLAGVGLLVLAIAELQLGHPALARKDHLLLLDTSAWMASRRSGTALIDRARTSALAWLSGLPASDRVLVIRVNGVATPVTAWDSSRSEIAQAIRSSQPEASALRLLDALRFAVELRQQRATNAGEIVYIGPRRIPASEASELALLDLPSLRILDVEDDATNIGIRGVDARRSAVDSDVWEVRVQVQNYGSESRNASLTLNFGHAPQGASTLRLAPQAAEQVEFRVRARAAGILETRLYNSDNFPMDNVAEVELPPLRPYPVVVYTERPDLVRPALATAANVTLEFRTPAQYSPSSDALMVMDRFRPPVPPQGKVIWIDPPSAAGPIRFLRRASAAAPVRWVPDQPLTVGLRAHDLRIDAPSAFITAPGDIAVAETDAGPTIVARSGGSDKTVAIGFDLFSRQSRYELSTPLLLANILEWMEPGLSSADEVHALTAGAVTLPADAGEIQVTGESGKQLPFSQGEGGLQIFSSDTGRLNVRAAGVQKVYSVSLPGMWDTQWSPNAAVQRGAVISGGSPASAATWRFLAAAGVILLLVEWLVYRRPMHNPRRDRIPA